MLRRLITLLAVLTGLTASVVPAHALENSVRAVQVTEQALAAAAQAGVSVTGVSQAQNRTTVREPARPRPVIVIQSPTVMLKADRARE